MPRRPMTVCAYILRDENVSRLNYYSVRPLLITLLAKPKDDMLLNGALSELLIYFKGKIALQYTSITKRGDFEHECSF